MIVVASGGLGGIVFIVIFCFLLSLGTVLFYLIRAIRYRCAATRAPRLKTWQHLFVLSPIIVLMVLTALMYWAMVENEKSIALEHEKDKSRYFTVQHDTAFGEITLPVGTYISKYIPRGREYHAIRDLNNVDGIQFPHPVMINGMAVLEISPTTGFLRLAEDYHFNQHGQQMTCPKTHYLLVALNNHTLLAPYHDQNLPVPPTVFKPSLWRFKDCTQKIEFPTGLPYWQDGKLIDHFSR